MERFKRLFREAERIEPPEGMWRKIAARSGLAARSTSGRQGAFPATARPAPPWTPWRMAASAALGLGLLSALLLLARNPDRGPEVAGTGPWKPGVTEPAAGSAGSEAEGEGAEAEDRAGSEGPEDWLDAELMAWHADLGEDAGAEPLTDWDPYPLVMDLASLGLEERTEDL